MGAISSASQQKKRARPAFPHPVLPDTRVRHCQFIRGQRRSGKTEEIISPVAQLYEILHAGLSNAIFRQGK
jgi:hypothetical protein